MTIILSKFNLENFGFLITKLYTSHINRCGREPVLNKCEKMTHIDMVNNSGSGVKSK